MIATSQPERPAARPPVCWSAPSTWPGEATPPPSTTPCTTHRDWGKDDHRPPALMFTSPRHDAHVAYLPESRYGGWKATQCREPLGTRLWSASFSRNTPAEITSAFTTALAEGLPSDHRDFLHAGPHHRTAAAPPGRLADRGWHDRRHRHVPLPGVPGRARLFRSAQGATSTTTWSWRAKGRRSGRCTAAWTTSTANAGTPTSPAPPRCTWSPETVRAFSSTEPVERPRPASPSGTCRTSPSARRRGRRPAPVGRARPHAQHIAGRSDSARCLGRRRPARAWPLTPPLTTPLEEPCRTTRTTSGGASTTSLRDTWPDRPSPVIPPSSPSSTWAGK